MDPNTTTQALLGLLVQNITGAAAPATFLPPPTGPTRIVMVAQSLLYFSLFSTLLAALLAVLGKQWLLHYDSVGERGTIEERGLERQRKFEGLRRWKFDVVMQMFPLLLQFSLLLFATALSIYLWTIHQGIAAIILAPTLLGFIFYIGMVISAVAWADSPFQTSLSFFLKILLQRIPLLRRFGTSSWKVMKTAVGHLGSFRSRSSSAFAGLMEAMKPFLPLFHSVAARDPTPPEPTPLFDRRPPPPSKEVSAVIWALETSTDPVMVQGAAGMIPELQWWPTNFDIQPSLKRLSDTFQSCVNDQVVRDGMSDRATACVKAFGVLDMVTDRCEGLSALWTSTVIKEAADNDLRSMVIFMCIDDADRLIYWQDSLQITQWTLRFIATQHPHELHLKTVLKYFSPDYDSLEDNSLFADFLFCVNSFFSPIMACDRSVLDKR
jgi:hypothetical protein